MHITKPVQSLVKVVKVNRKLAVISASINVTRRFGPVYLSARAYQYNNVMKHLVFRLDRVSCHNPILYQFAKIANATFDSKCFLEPGNFVVKSLDVNNYQWFLSKSITTAGTYAYELEFFNPTGEGICLRLVCEVSILTD
ncbi:hypothetical protein ACJJTC_015047 [Scirpophaga incertulas]